MGDLQSDILTQLSQRPRGLTTAQLVTKTGSRAPEVDRALQQMLALGVIRRQRALWVAVSTKSASPPHEPGPADALGSIRPEETAVRGASYTPTQSRLTIDPNSRWIEFRRLCAYYAECIRIGEHSTIRAYLDAPLAQWLPLTTPIRWSVLAARDVVTISLTAQECEIAQRLLRASDSKSLYLGAPVWLSIYAKTEERAESRSVTPPLVQRVTVDTSDRGVQIRAVGGAEANTGWFRHQFSDSARRKVILQELGLSGVDDDANDGSASPLAMNIAQCAARLLQWLPGRAREQIDISAPARQPALTSVRKGGLYNRVGLFAPAKQRYSRRLHKELETLAFTVSDTELDQSALAAIFEHNAAPAGTTPMPDVNEAPVAEYQLLSTQQQAACRSSLGRPLTVITGPPGTGKSLTVGHILANIAATGGTALLASRNHQAIAAVLPRLNALTDPEPVMLQPLRGSRPTEASFDWAQGVSMLLSTPVPASAPQSLEKAQAALRAAIDAVQTDEARIRERVERSHMIASTGQRLRAAAPRTVEFWLALANRQDEHPDARQLERMRRLHRKLAVPPHSIAARIWSAVLGPIRRHRYRCYAAVASQTLAKWHLTPSVLRSEHPIPALDRAVACVDMAQSLAAMEQVLLDERNAGVNDDALPIARAQMASALVECLKQTRDAALAAMPQTLRTEFAELRGSLRARSLEEVFSNRRLVARIDKALRGVLKCFPLWAVTNQSAHRVAPLQPGLFDVVVIDEASQSDIGSALPILYRAKRAVIVGDPNQLPHIASLSADLEMAVRRRHLVDSFKFDRFAFVTHSLYDIAAAAPAAHTIQLTDHFRSHPSIIGYCNEQFYAKQLRVRTADRGGNLGMPPCVWSHVPDDSVQAMRGLTSKGQQDAILAELQRLDAAGYVDTIGIVTPFRAQADRIRDRIHAAFPQDRLDRWRLLVQTADGFQGDERALILFSLVGGTQAPRGAMAFLAKERNRFNVAVSRAQQCLHVIGDVEWARTCQIPHITALVRHIDGQADTSAGLVRTDLIGPVWEPLLAKNLTELGIPFRQQYPACGFFLDFAIITKSLRLALEVDGERYHRDETGCRRLDDIYRDQLLISAGWEVMRFWVYELREDLHECLERIRRRLAADDRTGGGR